MAKIERKILKIFAETAPENEIGQFGSAIAGTKLETSDIEVIQALPAWANGWGAGVVSGNRYPALQERNGMDKVITYQLAYLLENGIAEYNENTTYYIGSYVRQPNTAYIYISLTDNNTGNLLTDTSAWKLMDWEGWRPLQEEKLNINFDNADATGKATAVGWCTPDYSAGVDYPNDTTSHTAPTDGVLTMNLAVAAEEFCHLKINNVIMGSSYHTRTYASYLTGQYTVRKGDTFQITATCYGDNYYFIYRFYPFKGVVNA